MKWQVVLARVGMLNTIYWAEMALRDACSQSEHYLKLFTIGVCEQAGLKIGCWKSHSDLFSEFSFTYCEKVKLG